MVSHDSVTARGHPLPVGEVLDEKIPALVCSYPVDLVKALASCWNLQFPPGRMNRLVRHPCLASSPCVAGKCLVRINIEVVRDRPEVRRTGAVQVFLAGLPIRVRVIDDEPLATPEAGIQKQILPPASPEHIQIDPDMGAKKVLQIEG